MLYIVPTPIGNLKDITLRALEVLQSVDGIICEDTRRTSLLLNHYQINKPLQALNDYNEIKEIPRIIQHLKEGRTLALVSDAGTPLISDPGYKLVRECIKQKIQVDSLPGPSSVITALTLSGLPPDKFMFLGYLPEKPGKRINVLKELSSEITYIVFVAPHKLLRTMESFKEVFGDIEITLAHELTKIHQSVETKTASEWLKTLKKPKGEYVLLFFFQFA
ncbi:16S rRNA (cytidine(1402)-2'-O)-methyltransferase [Candidatus Daviesbacteria bacterium]|nr:16S rRNA (cytidine(1402)-2'-O)-methyltransferase [Candidatus Daviesbacteria bacterium]